MLRPELTRYRATVAYDGTAYQGFQRQVGDTPTIQLALERAIQTVTGQEAAVLGAGRTDTGVHATGQVIAFDVAWKHDVESLLRALNATLPDDIALQDLRPHAGFHPRFDAVARVYRYHLIQSARRQPLLRHRAWRVTSDLNGDAMAAAAMQLLGEHDFAAFGRPPAGDSTIRLVMESNWSKRRAPYGWDWTYTIEANAFLHHMVRRVVGTLVAVGRGAMSLGEFEQAFGSRDMLRTGPLAPPHGLVLETVKYNDP